MNQTEEREHATSVVRLSFLPGHRDKIDTSEQWYKVMDTIKQEPNFGYVCKGESIDDELDIVLFIAWENAAKPPAAFRSGNLDCIFSPLSPFVAKKPQVMGTLYHMMERQEISKFVTTGAGMRFMTEIIAVRGPAHAIEPVLEEIDRRIKHYESTQYIAFEFYNYRQCTFLSGRRFRLGDDYEGHPDKASFVLHLNWRGREQRTEFQDADIPDRALPPHLQRNFPSNFWQESVIKPLEGSGATISSWTYHKGEIAHDEKGWRVIGSEFAQWYD
ncbi:hypothetical protein V8C42DRAFT_317639 [Trichoderma barbatum]